jgi:DNA-binding response OmpR family regulator
MAENIEICRTVRGFGRGFECGEVAILILNDPGSRDRCCDALDAGADDCQTKPVPFDEVAVRVQMLTRRRRSQTRQEPSVGRSAE